VFIVDIKINLPAELWLKESRHHLNLKFDKLQKNRLASHRFITGILIFVIWLWNGDEITAPELSAFNAIS